MNNEMTIKAGFNAEGTQVIDIVMNYVAVAVHRPLQSLTDYYSKVLERKIDNRQTLHMLNVQAAFVMTVFTDCALVLRAVCLLWLVAALMKCRTSLSER